MITCLRIFVILLLVTKISTSQISEESNVESSCDRKLICSECIKISHCTWCMKPLMDNKPRCFNSSLTYCDKEYLWNPKSEHKLLSARELTRAGSAREDGEGIVKMSPQSIDLKLRISESCCYYEIVFVNLILLNLDEVHRINWQYTEVQDYELDVYFLVDLAKSMESDIEKLYKLGDLLARTLPTITSKFRLGLGSFIDKNLMRNHEGGYPM